MKTYRKISPTVRSAIGIFALLFMMVTISCNSNSSNPVNNPGNPKDTTQHVDTTSHTDTTKHVDTTSVPKTLDINGVRTAQVDQSVVLTVVMKNSTGKTLTPGSIAWSSSDSTLIHVSGDGTVKPLRIGTVVITAISAGLQDTVLFTSSLSPYTFVFPDSLSSTDQQIIRDGVQYAHAFHQATFNRVIQKPTTVTGSFSAQGCASGGAAAFTGPQAVTFCVGNQGWKANGPILKQKIVQHETFHVWQFEYGWLGNPATAGADWVVEGSAELMGFKGIAAKNLLSYPTALGCQVKESADFTTRMPPGLPALSAVETNQAFQTTVGPLYTNSMLGMDYLTTGPGLTALKVYSDAIAAGTEWHTAFQTAFGISTTTFYTQFPTYMSGLTVPPNYLCGL